MPNISNILNNLHKTLLKEYGPQGWWPLSAIGGYHPNDFSYPKNRFQIYEICLGAILTQNVSWINVEKALINLKSQNCLDPHTLNKIDASILAAAIKPAGYYNQKAKKIKLFTQFFLDLKNKIPTRSDLLSLWGIGPETADSILLYAYKIPIFVIDTYTKTLLLNLNLITKKNTYHQIQELFHNNITADYKLFQEFHALIVANGKI